MRATSETWQIAGRAVRVTHLDKLYWPEDGVTKGDMLRYYLHVAPMMLPYLLNRPVTLRIFHNGIHGPSFYRRDRPAHAPAWLRSVGYQPETTQETIQLPLIDDAAGLVWLANQGSIEFHVWISRLPDLTQPDQVLFDLDPGDQAKFADVLRAALYVREALERLGLQAYAKTSGGRGLHICLPHLPALS